MNRRNAFTPFKTGTIHFCGIGGIGMSGLAEILHNNGYKVQGSDLKKSRATDRLKKMGITIHIKHKVKNLEGQSGEDIGLVVTSAAVPKDNVEILEAKQRHIPVVDRAEMLAEIMRLKWSIGIAGTHGKTTTTSIVSTMLDAGGFDPTVINGGIVNAYGTNARSGKGDWIVAEACEAFGSILKFRPTIGVITNIDPEHLDYYGTFDKLREAFLSYIENLPFYGFGVVCIDHPEIKKLVKKVTDRQVFTYGVSDLADVQANNIRVDGIGSTFDVQINGKLLEKPKIMKNLHIPTPGQHNVLNTLAAIVIGVRLGMSGKAIKEGLANFGGVKRRFTKTGEANGITIIDDYGHHPVEIKATLQAARSIVDKKNKVIAVFQPHRYTRLRDLFDDFCQCFKQAHSACITDVYAAGEKPIRGARQADLVKGIQATGHKDVTLLKSQDDLPDYVLQKANAGDIVVCLGAGSISTWANDLPKHLKANTKKKIKA